MFTVRFAPGVFLGFSRATIRAASFGQAYAIAGEFAPGGCGVICSAWVERRGRHVMRLYDWSSCCSPPPTPVLAWVTAPAGFVPPDRDSA